MCEEWTPHTSIEEILLVNNSEYRLFRRVHRTGSFQNMIAAPGYAKAHNLLGAALKDRLKLTEVEAAFQKAMELDSCDEETAVSLVGTLAERSTYGAVETLFRQVLAVRPDLASADEGYGKRCVDRRRYATANKLLARAAELRPDSHTSHVLLGLCRIHHADLMSL